MNIHQEIAALERVFKIMIIIEFEFWNGVAIHFRLLLLLLLMISAVNQPNICIAISCTFAVGRNGEERAHGPSNVSSPLLKCIKPLHSIQFICYFVALLFNCGTNHFLQLYQAAMQPKNVVKFVVWKLDVRNGLIRAQRLWTK